MDPNTIPLDYTNSLLFELEKAFWDERGKGAQFRLTTIGRDYFCKKCLPRLQSGEVEPIINAVEAVIREEGIAAKVNHRSEERLLKMRIEGCLHRPVEDQMVTFGIEPFTCLPANLIVLAIEAKLNQPVELAEIKLVDGACELLLVLFNEQPSLG